MVFVQSLSRAFVVASVALLVGCPAGDDTGGSAGDDTGVGGTTSSTSSVTVSASNTNGQTSQSTVDPPETSTSATTVDPPDTTGEDTTGGSEFCEPQLPPPVACAPLPPGDAPRVAQLPPLGGGDPIDGIFDPDPVGGPAFISPPDVGNIVECDIFLQDCGPGEKCMPWANDGGSSWNATRCSPIAAMPDAIGEACMVEGSGVSGLDTCEAASMCWNVDDTGQGTCVEMCSCSPDNPVCNTENTTCAISNGGVIAVCLSACNPLDPAACAAGEGCYPLDGQFLCAPDASGSGGEAGDECFNINGCSAGLICLSVDAVPGCAGAVGCCAATCASGDDAACPAGTTCMDWFQPGTAGDPCWQDVGVCSG